MTIGVASAQGSHDANSHPKSGSNGLCRPSERMMSTVWLASNKPAAHQIAGIQSQRIERARV
jgi:hypothetical protein